MFHTTILINCLKKYTYQAALFRLSYNPNTTQHFKYFKYVIRISNNFTQHTPCVSMQHTLDHEPHFWSIIEGVLLLTSFFWLAVKPPKSQNSERVKPPKSEYPTGIKSRNLIPPKSQFTERLLMRRSGNPKSYSPQLSLLRRTDRSPESPKSRTVPEVSLLRIFIPPMPILYRDKCLAYQRAAKS